MKTCSKCVLPETFPGISFDDQAVCNYCRHTPLPDEAEKKAYIRKFEQLLDEIQSCFLHGLSLPSLRGQNGLHRINSTLSGRDQEKPGTCCNLFHAVVLSGDMKKPISPTNETGL